MSTAQRTGNGKIFGWVLPTLLGGLSLAAAPVLLPGDLLTPGVRVPHAGLITLVTLLLAALQAQWLLGRARQRQHEEQRARLEDMARQHTLVLEKARHDLLTVLDAVPAKIGYWDCDLTNRVANRAYHERFDVPAGQLPGRNMRELMGVEPFERIRPHVEAALRGERRAFESSTPRTDGRDECHTLSQFVPDCVGEQVLGFYAIVHDITEQHESRRLLTDALRENEALLHTIRTHSIYSVADVHGNILEVNEGLCRISGYTRDELLGRNHRVFSSGTHDTAFWRTMWRCIAAGQAWRGEICNRAKDGSLYWVDSIVAPFCRADGKPERYVTMRHDITAAKRAVTALGTERERLRDSEAFLESVGAVAGVGGWEYDVERGRLTWTRQTRRISGVDDGYEPTLSKSLDFYPEDSRALIARAMHEAVETGRPFDLELAYRTATGKHLWVRAVGEAQGEAYGAGVGPRRVVGAFQDITERRRSSEALIEAKAAAEAASAAKSAFLSNMSHEIRTPLNAVIGVAHLLADSPMNEDQRLLLSKAQLAGRSLLGIVNDVLDLAKIEAGEMALDEAPYQPLALLAEIDAVYAPQARQKGLAFTAEVAPDVPAWLQGDCTRLRQLLVNLVANALKFTSVGGVQVELSRTDPAPGRCGLMVRVRDSGIGIDPDVQARLFSPFIQADASTTRRFGGTGLGLSIVSRLAQIMGGEVGVNSTPGVGSDFWVAVPQAVPSVGDADSVSRGHATLEVLVVDDNAVDRLGLTSQVRALGWQALPLESGAALVREVGERLASGRPPPDAMLVDWLMPGMDGLQALAALAAQVGPDRVPAALLVSAHERARIDGLHHVHLADHILTKPVGSSALFNAVNDSLARRQGSTEKVLQSTRVDATDALWLAGVRVLLVDDSEINLEVARRLLERWGARVQTCTRGREALDLLSANPAAFDAVLMDVQMPDMDGLEATRCIRGELGLVELPVIALTAGALVEERRRALDAGMQAFLPKPLDPAQLIRVLRRLVEAARGTALPVLGLDRAPAADGMRWPVIEGIDTTDVAGRLGNDVPLFLSMLRRLLLEFGDLAAPGPGMLDDPARRQALVARLHKLRGSAGTIGARELLRLAAAAETSLRASSASAGAALAAVSLAVERLAEQGRTVLGTTAADADPGEGDGEGVAGSQALTPSAHQELQGLLQMLRRQDLAALDRFKRLDATLRATLGARTTRSVTQALEALEFSEALALLTAGVEPVLEAAET